MFDADEVNGPRNISIRSTVNKPVQPYTSTRSRTRPDVELISFDVFERGETSVPQLANAFASHQSTLPTDWLTESEWIMIHGLHDKFVQFTPVSLGTWAEHFNELIKIDIYSILTGVGCCCCCWGNQLIKWIKCLNHAHQRQSIGSFICVCQKQTTFNFNYYIIAINGMSICRAINFVFLFSSQSKCVTNEQLCVSVTFPHSAHKTPTTTNW